MSSLGRLGLKLGMFRLVSKRRMIAVEDDHCGAIVEVVAGFKDAEQVRTSLDISPRVMSAQTREGERDKGREGNGHSRSVFAITAYTIIIIIVVSPFSLN